MAPVFSNYISIMLLERLGVRDPSQQQIDLIEMMVNHASLKHQILYNKRLTRRERLSLLGSR